MPELSHFPQLQFGVVPTMAEAGLQADALRLQQVDT